MSSSGQLSVRSFPNEEAVFVSQVFSRIRAPQLQGSASQAPPAPSTNPSPYLPGEPTEDEVERFMRGLTDTLSGASALPPQFGLGLPGLQFHVG